MFLFFKKLISIFYAIFLALFPFKLTWVKEYKVDVVLPEIAEAFVTGNVTDIEKYICKNIKENCDVTTELNALYNCIEGDIVNAYWDNKLYHEASYTRDEGMIKQQYFDIIVETENTEYILHLVFEVLNTMDIEEAGIRRMILTKTNANEQNFDSVRLYVIAATNGINEWHN